MKLENMIYNITKEFLEQKKQKMSQYNIDSELETTKKIVIDLEIIFENKKTKYTGEVISQNDNIMPHGKGEMIFFNGDKFSGSIKYGNPTKGTYTFENGSFCEVEYDEDLNIKYKKPYGYRKPKSKNKYEVGGKCYFGELKEGLPDGIGTMYINTTKFWQILPRTEIYEGGFSKGEMHGVGKYTFMDDTYEINIYNKGEKVTCIDKFTNEKKETIPKENINFKPERDKQIDQKVIQELLNEGNKEGALRILANYSSNDTLTLYNGYYHTTSTVADIEDYIKSDY